MDHIDDLGGAAASIESGYMQAEIQEASVQWQQEVESKERTIVGVNAYIDPSEDATPLFRPNHEIAQEQLDRLERLRENRDVAAVDEALNHLRGQTRTDTNLMPAIIDCVRVYATLGEICHIFRDEWGEYTPVTVV
jgi:methylmalonyl-CoA mutase N-terminal domain/subunit